MPKIIEAVISSTEKYLKFLEEQEGGTAKYRASFTGALNTSSLINGTLHYCYQFKTQRKLRLSSDTRVEFISRASGDKYGALILEYSKDSGLIILGFLEEDPPQVGDIVVDYKWLVRRLLEWFRSNGSRLSNGQIKVFDTSDAAERVNSLSISLSEEQRQAVTQALTKKLTYTWGPPGSGKTTYALAGLADCLIRSRRRVLLVAPTNMALDTALRAVIERALQCDCPITKIIRLGLPTPEFVQEYPDACENIETRETLQILNRRIEELTNQKEMLGKIAKVEIEMKEAELRILSLEQSIADLLGDQQRIAIDRDDLKLKSAKDEERQLEERKLFLERERRRLGPLSKLLGSQEQKRIAEELNTNNEQLIVNKNKQKQLELDVAEVFKGLKKLRSEQNRLSSELDEKRTSLREMEQAKSSLTSGMSDEEITLASFAVSEVESELSKLRAKQITLEVNLSEKQLIAVTLDGFVGRSSDRGLDVNWVILDEAGYSGLAKVLPLLSLKCPISMFGDHRQLPPVCEADDRSAEIWAFWGKSGLFLETALTERGDYSRIAQTSVPLFNSFHKTDLTVSYRFDDRLATILDAFVYQVGLTGVSRNGTMIEAIEVATWGGSLLPRVSENEIVAVVAVCEKLISHGESSVAVLTPYKKQVEGLRRALRSAGIDEQIEVVNTHRAQGREWDTVVFSVVDGSKPPNKPHFTDSSSEIGIQVLNTTISRVKKRLIVVAERGYWASRSDQLVGTLLTVAADRE